jgi:hypothetical protein
MTKWAGILSVVGAWMVAGCSGGGPAGSCRSPGSAGGGETCVDFVAGYSSSSAMEACALASTSTFAATACATNNRVGRCTASSPDGAFTQTQNYYGPTTVAQAMTACTAARGMFTAN